MKKTLVLMMLLASAAIADEYSDRYSLSVRLDVPQVFDNMLSQGYRKYATQTITGQMYINWYGDYFDGIYFSDLENQKFKVGGKKVTYKGMLDQSVTSARFNYIGNNKTGVFKIPCLSFFAYFEPSYAIAEVSEDNSFYLHFAGKGASAMKKKHDAVIATRFSGKAAGTQGCSCADYGHKSPTRSAMLYGPGETVEDAVATMGTWSAVWRGRFIVVR